MIYIVYFNPLPYKFMDIFKMKSKQSYTFSDFSNQFLEFRPV